MASKLVAAVEDPGLELVLRVDAMLAVPIVDDPSTVVEELTIDDDAVETKLELWFNEDMLAPKKFEVAVDVVVNALTENNAVDEAPVPESELDGITLNEVKEALEVVADEFAGRGIAEDAPVPEFNRDVARVAVALDEGETVEVCVATN